MTTTARKLRFGAFMSVPSCHPTGWRHPDADPETDLSVKQLLHMARTAGARQARLHVLPGLRSPFPGSTATYGGRPFRVKSGRQAHIEPMTAIAAIGAITKNLGLISTCTTSYNEPYNVARRFLTIDHISGGRAGWNLVTSQAEDEAVNFGRDQHFEHGIRYERASEFHDVVVGCGIRGRTTPSCATRRRASGSTTTRCTSSITRASTSTCAGRSTSRARRRAAR
jgi:hypothetical protein